MMKVAVYEKRIERNGCTANGDIVFEGEFPDAGTAMKSLLPQYGANRIYHFGEAVSDADALEALMLLTAAKWAA